MNEVGASDFSRTQSVPQMIVSDTPPPLWSRLGQKRLISKCNLLKARLLYLDMHVTQLKLELALDIEDTDP